MIINVHGIDKKTEPPIGQQFDTDYELPRTRTPMIVSAILGLVVVFIQTLFARSLATQPDVVPEESQARKAPDEELIAAETDEQPQRKQEEEEEGSAPSSRDRFAWDVPDSLFAPVEAPPVPVPPLVLAPANGLDLPLTFPQLTSRPAKGYYPSRPLQPSAAQDAVEPPRKDGSKTTPDAEVDEEIPTPENRAPRNNGPVVLRDVAYCAHLVILGHHLLVNTVDPDGDSLAVLNVSATRGSIKWSDGQWTYQPEPYATGPVTLTYKITDGKHVIEQTAQFSVVSPAPIIGTAGDDILIGGYCSDDIDGGEGNDIIDGGSGNDTIHGGGGNDHIMGGMGDDIIYGGDGHDVIFGAAGNDQIFGGAGNDRIFGELGDDLLFGEDGDDIIYGGAGNDLIVGGEGDDRLYGEADADIIFGGAGDDHIEGGDGNDRLFGDAGNDTILGGAGDDFIEAGDGDDVIDGGEGNDTIYDGAGSDEVGGGSGNDIIIAAADGADDHFDGGKGCDTLDYSAANEALLIDLNSGIVCSEEVGNDTFTGFEEIIGGEGDDHFIFGNASAVLHGGGGNNVYQYVAPTEPGSNAPTLFEIVDFKKGDLIKMSKYKIFEKVFDQIEDEFERIYGDDIDEDDARIRYRYEESDGQNRTIIEADFNRDNIFETSIVLNGSQALVFLEAQ